MDNLAESFYKQTTNARQLRSQHEENAIGLMKQMGLTSSTIQVSGASLQMKKSKTAEGLTWGYLEREIAAWGTQARLTPDQVASLLKWLHEHREMRETEFLKKSIDIPKASSQ